MIEDDLLICEMVADCFRTELGAEVVCALTGPDGARMIMGYAFDLAVIDAVLPDVRASHWPSSPPTRICLC